MRIDGNRQKHALNWRRIGIAANDRVQKISDMIPGRVCHSTTPAIDRGGAKIWVRILGNVQGRVRRATRQLRG